MSRAERRALVEREAPALPVSRQCRLLAVSRASVYRRPAEISEEDGTIMALIDRQCTCRLLPRPARPSPLFRRVGIRNFTFEALRLHTRYGPPDRPRRPLSRDLGSAGYPTKPPVSYQIKPTTVWVASSSTGIPHHRDAPKKNG
jgi:hypothetical protein